MCLGGYDVINPSPMTSLTPSTLNTVEQANPILSIYQCSPHLLYFIRPTLINLRHNFFESCKSAITQLTLFENDNSCRKLYRRVYLRDMYFIIFLTL